MNQSNYFINSQDLLKIKEITDKNKTPANTTYAQNAELAMDTNQGIKIYIRAVKKIEEHLQKIKHNCKEIEVAKKYRKEHEVAQKNADNAMITNDAQRIVAEFIKGLSVVYDEVAMEMTMLLLKRFTFIKESLELFLITKKERYLDECFIITGRLKDTFNQMLDIANSASDRDTKETDVANSGVSA